MGHIAASANWASVREVSEAVVVHDHAQRSQYRRAHRSLALFGIVRWIVRLSRFETVSR
jgi:hypothetical protein